MEWITELPDHWKREKISRVGFLKGRIGWRGYTSNDIRDANEGFLTIGATQITKNGTIDLSKATFISKEKYEESPEIKLFGNEILIVKVGATIGKIGFFPEGLGDATINPNVMIFSSVKYFNRFIFYSFKGEYLQILLELNKSAGAQDAINQEFFNNLWLFLPPLPEQHAIAAFLDHETARIDALIEKKERQIELLEEKRAALINHAVTKGLDANAKMKDSGIEWIGEVPEHWEVMHLQRVCRLQQGLQIAQSERFYEPGPNRVKYITVKMLHSNPNESLFEYIENPSERVICYHNDILFARTGATGEVITGVEGAFHNNFFKVNFNKNQIIKQFLIYYLQMPLMKEHFILFAGTTTIPDLNHDDFLASPLLLPEITEQKSICDYLDLSIGRVQFQIARINESIELLEEYRSGIISAAVTGKIDVLQEALV